MIKTLPMLASTLLLAFTLTACGDEADSQVEGGAAAAAAAEAGHEHGADTHTHEVVADTAGTYVDSTGAFFGEGDAAEADADHVHGPETHEH